MAAGESQQELIQRESRSPHYREVTPDYIFGGVKPGFVEMSAITTKASAFEKLVNNCDVITHTEEVSLKLSPIQAKNLIIWLLQNIKVYEDTFGQIKIVESDTSKQELNKKVDELLASL